MVVDDGVNHLDSFGDYMKQNEIRRAIDVVLDPGLMAVGKLPGVSAYADAHGGIGQYVAYVEKLLGRLDNMPPVDPPEDLVSKTIAFVAHASGHERRPTQPSLFNQPPSA